MSSVRSLTKPPWRQHSSVFSGHCQTQDVVVSPPLQSSSPRYRLQISARNIVTLAINVTRKKHSNTFKEKTRATDWRTALCSLSFGFRLYTDNNSNNHNNKNNNNNNSNNTSLLTVLVLRLLTRAPPVQSDSSRIVDDIAPLLFSLL